MIGTRLLLSWRQARAAILRFLVAESAAGNLGVGQAQERVVLSFRNFHRSGKRAIYDSIVGIIAKFCRVIFSVGIVIDPFFRYRDKRHPGIILERFPGTQSFLQLFREHGRVASRLESLLRHLAGDLMMAVPVGAPTHKNRSNYERTRYAHHANHVGQHTIPSPFLGMGAPRRDPSGWGISGGGSRSLPASFLHPEILRR